MCMRTGWQQPCGFHPTLVVFLDLDICTYADTELLHRLAAVTGQLLQGETRPAGTLLEVIDPNLAEAITVDPDYGAYHRDLLFVTALNIDLPVCPFNLGQIPEGNQVDPGIDSGRRLMPSRARWRKRSS